jgi:hypothetical protein
MPNFSEKQLAMIALILNDEEKNYEFFSKHLCECCHYIFCVTYHIVLDIGVLPQSTSRLP